MPQDQFGYACLCCQTGCLAGCGMHAFLSQFDQRPIVGGLMEQYIRPLDKRNDRALVPGIRKIDEATAFMANVGACIAFQQNADGGIDVFACF